MPDMWIDVDTAVTVPVNIMPLTDDTDFKTRETAIVYNQAGMDLVWNFQTSAGVTTQTAVTPTTAGDYDWTNSGDGMYKIEIPASGGASINNDTEGYGWFTGICTGVLAWRGPVIGFRATALNDALCDGGDNLDVNTIQVGGTIQTAGDIYGSLPTNFASMVISASGAVDSLVQGILNTLVTETTAGRLAGNLSTLLDNSDATATLTLDAIALAATVATAAELAKVPKSDGSASWNATALAAIQSEANDALIAFWTSPATLVSLIWSESMTGYSTTNTAGKILKGIAEGWISAEGSVNDASATTTSFITDLTSAVDNFYNDATLAFITGSLKGQSRPVISYNGTTKAVTFDEAFTSAPADTDQFIILNSHTHPMSEIINYMDANSTQLAAILADTNELQTDDVPGLIAALNNISTSDVLTQVNAALDTAIAELSIGVPSATPTIRTGLMLLYMMSRNRVDVNTTGVDSLKVYNDAGAQIASKIITDDGTDYSEAKMS